MLNDTAKFLAIAGFILGVLSWMFFSLILGETKTTKAIGFFATGGFVAVIDLLLRAVLRPEDCEWRFVSLLCGGRILFAPAWVGGLVIIGAGISILMDDS